VAVGDPSKADSELASAVTRSVGFEVTPRQIERWRQEGALEPPNRRGLGRGRGTVAYYPPQAVSHAVALAKLIKEGRSLADAALICFLKGSDLKEVPLKRSYRKVFESIRGYLGATQESDPWEVADRMTHRFTRRTSTSPTAKLWQKRLKDRGKPDQLGPVLQDLLRFGLGGADRDETLSGEVLEAVVGDAADQIQGAQRAEFDSLVQQINLPALEDVMENSDLATLKSARDQVRVLMELFPAPDGLIPSNIEFAMAVIGVPAVIVAGAFFGTSFARGIAELMHDRARE